MAFHHTITCDEETECLINEKKLSPSECFRIGVRKMACQTNNLNAYGEVIEEETALNKAIQARDALQKLLLEQREELDALKKKKTYGEDSFNEVKQALMKKEEGAFLGGVTF